MSFGNSWEVKLKSKGFCHCGVALNRPSSDFNPDLLVLESKGVYFYLPSRPFTQFLM